MEARLRELITGAGADILMACVDGSIMRVYIDGPDSAGIEWSAAAPEQIEAHILDILLEKQATLINEGDTLTP